MITFMEAVQLKISPAQVGFHCELPLYLAKVAAGFPSPAEDYIDQPLDLNKHLIKHPVATFFVRVSGSSMVNAGIGDGDLLIVDRAAQPVNGSVVIAIIYGELTVKRIQRRNGQVLLVPDNGQYEPIEVTEGMDFQIWGVCRHVIHQL